MPALQTVDLRLPRPLVPTELGCLLNALSWLPRLQTLDLSVDNIDADDYSDDEASQPCPDASAFAKLRSLTKLRLSFGGADTYTVAGVVDALVSLTGLVQLELGLPRSTVVPAALGQLKGLRSLVLCNLRLCDFEAGCLELPNLTRLDFDCCSFLDLDTLPGVTALQNLISIIFAYCQGPHFFDRQLVQLPRMRELNYHACETGGACQWLSQPSADMGSLASSLRYLACSGVGLTQFPALTQLVTLERLDLRDSEFAVVPFAITALSRLSELLLGRWFCDYALHQCKTRPLDARALGDLSAFPALRELDFSHCEVMLCESMLGAVRHASLSSIAFHVSHPAPECALMVLQLSRALGRLGRGSVLRCEGYVDREGHTEQALQKAHALPPLYKFQVALQAYGI